MFLWPRELPIEVVIKKAETIHSLKEQAILAKDFIYDGTKDPDGKKKRVTLYICYNAKSKMEIGRSFVLLKGTKLFFLDQKEFQTKDFAFAILQGPTKKNYIRTYLPTSLFRSDIP